MWPHPSDNFPSFRSFWTFPVKVACFFAYGAVIEFVTYKVVQYLLKKNPDGGEDVDVLFFSDKCHNCWSHICKKIVCSEKCAYIHIRKLVKYIEEARETLDVCIYTITSYDFAYSILAAHKRGVKVRVITDDNRVKGCGSQIFLFKESGLPVHTKSSTYDMHHKFVIVDNTILVNGSFNWTMQAFTGNWENAIVCNNEAIVNVFSQHFDDLWADFSQQDDLGAASLKTDLSVTKNSPEDVNLGATSLKTDLSVTKHSPEDVNLGAASLKTDLSVTKNSPEDVNLGAASLKTDLSVTKNSPENVNLGAASLKTDLSVTKNSPENVNLGAASLKTDLSFIKKSPEDAYTG